MTNTTPSHTDSKRVGPWKRVRKAVGSLRRKMSRRSRSRRRSPVRYSRRVVRRSLRPESMASGYTSPVSEPESDMEVEKAGVISPDGRLEDILNERNDTIGDIGLKEEQPDRGEASGMPASEVDDKEGVQVSIVQESISIQEDSPEDMITSLNESGDRKGVDMIALETTTISIERLPSDTSAPDMELSPTSNSSTPILEEAPATPRQSVATTASESSQPLYPTPPESAIKSRKLSESEGHASSESTDPSSIRSNPPNDNDGEGYSPYVSPRLLLRRDSIKERQERANRKLKESEESEFETAPASPASLDDTPPSSKELKIDTSFIALSRGLLDLPSRRELDPAVGRSNVDWEYERSFSTPPEVSWTATDDDYQRSNAREFERPVSTPPRSNRSDRHNEYLRDEVEEFNDSSQIVYVPASPSLVTAYTNYHHQDLNVFSPSVERSLSPLPGRYSMGGDLFVSKKMDYEFSQKEVIFNNEYLNLPEAKEAKSKRPGYNRVLSSSFSDRYGVEIKSPREEVTTAPNQLMPVTERKPEQTDESTSDAVKDAPKISDEMGNGAPLVKENQDGLAELEFTKEQLDRKHAELPKPFAEVIFTVVYMYEMALCWFSRSRFRLVRNAASELSLKRWVD
ncbi:hypothetical protein BKA69DRAFT_1052683 [Paraphysoderma sedebokerense]|nr:hypothetical protein BKA69DRAFT_1052683 [Paraphysoderma sedebokerense]